MTMDAQLLISSIAVGLMIMSAAVGFLLIARGYANRRIRERLDDVIAVDEENQRAKSVILRDLELSTVPLLNQLLKDAKWARRLDTLLVQGDIPLRLGSFIVLSLLLGSLGLFVTASMMGRPFFALPVGLLAALTPFVYARHRKATRVRKFEEQFPDALEMLTNALRAGMALPSAIQVVSEESPDPIAREFSILFEETRLGLDLKEALKKLAERVDSAELRLFVTAVIIHRETGGNLAEILDGTAAVIRDRFRILGDVRSMTAQARLSGLILMVLPLVLAAIVMFVAPEYLKGLVADPIGRHLVVGAVILQVVGFLSMRRIVNIKV